MQQQLWLFVLARQPALDSHNNNTGVATSPLPCIRGLHPMVARLYRVHAPRQKTKDESPRRRRIAIRAPRWALFRHQPSTSRLPRRRSPAIAASRPTTLSRHGDFLITDAYSRPSLPHERRSGPDPQFSHHRSSCALPTTPHSSPHCARLEALLRRFTAACQATAAGCRSASYERRRDGTTTSAVGWKTSLHRTA